MDRGRGRKACIRNSESRFVVNTIYTFLLYGNGWQIGKIQDIGKHGIAPLADKSKVQSSGECRTERADRARPIAVSSRHCKVVW